MERWGGAAGVLCGENVWIDEIDGVAGQNRAHEPDPRAFEAAQNEAHQRALEKARKAEETDKRLEAQAREMRKKAEEVNRKARERQVQAARGTRAVLVSKAGVSHVFCAETLSLVQQQITERRLEKTRSKNSLRDAERPDFTHVSPIGKHNALLARQQERERAQQSVGLFSRCAKLMWCLTD